MDTLESFGVRTRVLDISRGPSVTRYEVQPMAGVKISHTSPADDIALNLAVADVRMEAPIPAPAVGIVAEP
ncbi:MAG: DNA translocase FtsK [Faecalibacterium sp.]